MPKVGYKNQMWMISCNPLSLEKLSTYQSSTVQVSLLSWFLVDAAIPRAKQQGFLTKKDILFGVFGHITTSN